MFISYTQWFNDNLMMISLSDKSIGRLWICWCGFTKQCHVMPDVLHTFYTLLEDMCKMWDEYNVAC